jgi:hypothetical protein
LSGSVASALIGKDLTAEDNMVDMAVSGETPALWRDTSTVETTWLTWLLVERHQHCGETPALWRDTSTVERHHHCEDNMVDSQSMQ